ncbi:DUF3732 domain-containing protein [Brevibacillus nitrificans]|uniref:DUF3732 domain-containing protein n=1 Tax=Brevibacillus nitrificans TaxID=651560 RepID=UPI0028631FEA|nr:DUF3732 domain-containing protein [Brevibacillus nitrificans]MDR7319698.1 phage shock protein A [Brevibacillus nitrificans]
MNAYIKAIVVFNSEGDKRYVPLQEGLNIITGESKSGKSALLEIIDYCLGSSKSTIPKGEVTKFGSLFSLIIKFPLYNLVIGRRAFEDTGRKSMYIIRLSEEIHLEQLSFDLFNEKHELSVEQAKREIGQDFGLTITDLTEDSSATQKEGRPTVRNMVSYLLQHQNLVANKFTLFYRFEDSKKREQVIGQFPVFAGWVDQRYYSLKLELDELLKKRKQNERFQINYNQSVEKLRKQLLKEFQVYYSLMGQKLSEDIPINKLLELRNTLPDFTRKSYLTEEMEARYTELKKRLEELRNQRSDIVLTIKNLELSQGFGYSYSKNLQKLKTRLKYTDNLNDHYDCPLCGNEVNNINDKVIALKESRHWLQKELAGVGGQRSDFGEQIRKLNRMKNDISDDIKELNKEITKFEEIFEKLKENKKYEDEVIYAKASLDLQCKLIEEQLQNKDHDSDELDDDIEYLRTKIKDYNLDSYYAKAKAFFDQNISRIIEKLDFEEEFRPADMNFNLHTFDLYHFDKDMKSKVYLSEMGSGANWLACHLSLFLTFIHFFSIQDKSSIPSVLFLDQPSQVYFPEKVYVSGSEKPQDIQKVEQIYIAMLEEIDLIEEKAGFKPQIIVTDHVGELDLGKYKFEEYVRKNWRGEKFI